MADNVATVKDMIDGWMGGGKDSSKLEGLLADDAKMTRGDGTVTEGKDAIMAMVKGMMEKMGDMKIVGSNYTAADADTVTYDMDRNGTVEKRKIVFAGGKIKEMCPA